MADNEADKKAADARAAQRKELDADTDRRLKALDRSAHAKPRGKK